MLSNVFGNITAKNRSEIEESLSVNPDSLTYFTLNDSKMPVPFSISISNVLTVSENFPMQVKGSILLE